MPRIFYDSEFTGLHQASTLISIALVSECERLFYAEFTDYARDQCDEWLRAHVLAQTRWLTAGDSEPFAQRGAQEWYCLGNREAVRREVAAWLAQFDQVEIWADVPAYDWVLFCQLFGGALELPKNVLYIPFDLATLFKLKGMDPDTDRESFAALPPGDRGRHYALRDAQVGLACLRRLVEE